MKKFNHKTALLLLGGILLLSAVPAARAATQEEMDRARAIAAQVYLRYTNEKADYLDGFKPHSVSDLRAKVSGHGEDEENLRKFLAAPVSNDYAQWGQEEMAEYWGGSFFQGAGLSDKGADTRNRRIISRIRTMDVTRIAPEPETPDPAQTQPVQQPSEDYNAYPQEVAPQPAAPAVDSTSVIDDNLREEVRQSSSNLWLYIVLLIILVGVVIGLVVYAMKAMKGQQKERGIMPEMPQQPQQPQPSRPTYTQEPVAASRRQSDYGGDSGFDDTDSRYARVIASKNEEIERLRAEVADARSHAEQISARLGAMQLEMQRLTEENNALRAERIPQPVVPAPAPGVPRGYDAMGDIPASAPRPRRYDPVTESSAGAVIADRPVSGERVIYLGRANRHRVFVRADKNIVSGKSVYRLVTTNGITGSFTVDTDPAVAGWVALDPETALFGGAEVASFANAATFTRIVTDSAGTAIFEDGCWKVLRPAAVHLE